MNDSPQEVDDAHDTNGGSSSYRRPLKEYDVAESKPKAFMVENAQWKRIRARVDALEAKGNIDWLMAVATMVGGIAASAGLALLVLPKATKNSVELASFVKPALWAVFLGGSAVAIAMILLWISFRSAKSKTASDICNEMDTIQAAWQESKSADPAT